MHEAKQRDEVEVSVWAPVTPRREFLYSYYMADATAFLVELPDENCSSLSNDLHPSLINIGLGEDLTIKELMKLVKEVVGFQGGLFFDESKPDGTALKLMAVEKINKLGWKAQTILEKGAKQACRDYLNARSSSYSY